MDSAALVKSSFSAIAFGLSYPRTNWSCQYSLSCLSGKLKISSICASLNPHSQPPNPFSKSRKYCFSVNPFSLLLPLVNGIKTLAGKSSTDKLVTVLQRFSDSNVAPDECRGYYLKNGGFGMALLSMTSSAKVKISPFVATLAANPTFMSGLLAWAIAQSMKVALNFFVERKWDLRIMFTSGGMPSSHSALCTALTASVAICHGVADALFPVCLGFSLIVMYDAIGVRRHAGMQAEVLNMIVEDLFQGHPISQRKLKELLGHTPSQVFAGALLGILVACLCSRCSLVAI